MEGQRSKSRPGLVGGAGAFSLPTRPGAMRGHALVCQTGALAGAIRVPVPKPSCEGNHRDLRVEDAESAIDTAICGSHRQRLAATGGVFCGL